MKYPGPIMSLALSPASTHLAVGMTDGILSIRHRPKEETILTEVYKKSNDRALARLETAKGDEIFEKAFQERGVRAEAPKDAIQVTTGTQAPSLRDYEGLLKKFQYGRALDAALKTGNSIVVLSLFEEFMYRQALDIPLSGRNELTLMPILKFLNTHITKPYFAPTLLQVFEKILDIYLPVLNQSSTVSSMLRKINLQLKREIQVQEDLHSLVGILELLGSA